MCSIVTKSHGATRTHTPKQGQLIIYDRISNLCYICTNTRKIHSRAAGADVLSFPTREQWAGYSISAGQRRQCLIDRFEVVLIVFYAYTEDKIYCFVIAVAEEHVRFARRV